MADEAAGGAPGGAPAGNPGSGSPAGGGAPSAPAAATPAPAAPVTPVTPVVAPVAGAPATEVSERPRREVGEEVDDYMKRDREWRTAQAEKTATEPKPGDTVKPPVAEVKPAIDPAKPVVEAPKEEVKTEQKPPVVGEEPALDLDKYGELPASKVSEALKADPVLEQKLAAAGVEPELLFGRLRMASAFEHVQNELGLPDVESIKYVAEQASDYASLDGIFSEIQRGDMASTAKFIQALNERAAILGEDGKPLYQEYTMPDGSKQSYMVTDGSVNVLLDNVADMLVNRIRFDAEASGKDPEKSDYADKLTAGADWLEHYLKNNELEGQDLETLPEPQRKQVEALNARQRQAAETERNEGLQKFETWKKGTTDSVNTAVNTRIGKLLEETSLAELSNDSAEEKARKSLLRDAVMQKVAMTTLTALKASKPFEGWLMNRSRHGTSATNTQVIVQEHLKRAEGMLQRALGPALKAAGAERVRQSAARLNKIAAQQKASQAEPVGTTSPAATAPKTGKSEQDIIAEAKANLRARGDDASDIEMVMAERRRIKREQAA